MRRMNTLLAGSLMMLASTGTVYTPVALADHGQRAALSERIGHGGSTYSNYILDGAVACKISDAKIPSPADSKRIGHGGSIYSFTRVIPNEARDCTAKNQHVIAEERIGHGGSTYYSGETMTN